MYQRMRTPELLPQAQRFRNDLRPGAHQGRLTLADGSSVLMNDPMAIAARLRQQAPSTIVKLTTTRGESFSVTLSDGTKIWLNSSSSLAYPAAFNGNSRQVELSGEAYFEVKHDAAKPFSVKLPDGSQVKDIGTRFNIHAYANEPAIKTTLIEGAVEVEARGKQLLLKPGQQAEHTAGQDLTVHEAPDQKNTVAWKDDEFRLQATDIRTIMLQVERWYNALVVYKDDMQNDSTQFFGTLPRNVPVSELLKMLESTGHVHFMIEGNKITVMK
jgi:ferric-dicitrate binding protein FerR (iron transport regulator)